RHPRSTLFPYTTLFRSVVEEMTVKGPAAGHVGGDEIAQPLARFDVDRVLVGAVGAVPVIELAPQTVQMDRVLHHRVVDQHKAHPDRKSTRLNSSHVSIS